jgi:phosphatidylserine/phosphatidylglycerophosphate/cardiolipin synthase-like enzyme
VVGGHAVDSWFSPSDRTTAHIVENVYTAEMEILFATFSFTKDEIGDAVVDIFSNNIPVRGMIENISDPGVEIDYLNSVGIDCRPHAITGDLHHKYAVIDANGSDPKVITGSHNWSVSAETANDENTLVLHDERLASLFKAEFEKRWQENAVSIASVEQPVVQISPNPVIDYFTLQNTDAVVQQWEVQDMLGRVVAAGIPDEATLRVSVGVASLKPGHYVAFIRTLYDVRALPFQKI